MRATKVNVRQNRIIAPYQSEHIEIEIELNEGERVQQAVAKGRVTLAHAFGEAPTEEDVAAAREIIAMSEEETL